MPCKRAGLVASPRTRRGSSALLAVIASLTSLWVVGCADYADDCNYNLTCPSHGLGGSSAGTGATPSGGNQSGTGGVVGGNAGSSVAGGTTATTADQTTSGGTAAAGTVGTGGIATGIGGIGIGGTSSSSGGVGTGGLTTTGSVGVGAGGLATGDAGTGGIATGGAPPCNGACTGATPICEVTLNQCVACVKDTPCPTGTVCDKGRYVCVGCIVKTDCSGATPTCDTETNTCVECTQNPDCPTNKPRCKTAFAGDAGDASDASDASDAGDTSGKLNVCVECELSTDCKEATRPVCNATANACVGCVASTDCKDASKPQCNTATQTCVACLSNTDCKTAAASKCDLTQGSATINTCLPCAANTDCAQVTGKNVCLSGVTGQPNQCVTCTAANETACINGTVAHSCNPKTYACTTTVKGSRKTCYSCQADSECGTNAGVVDPNSRCVPMTFNGTAHGTGGYCLQRASTVATCARPYSVGFSAVSLSGAASESYCGINQTDTTCEALLDLFSSTTCTKDSNCGGGSGGLCRQLGTGTNPPYVCTIPCGSTAECLSSGPGSTCSGTTSGWCQ